MLPGCGQMNWVQYTFPSILPLRDEDDESQVDGWMGELNKMMEQLRLICVICPPLEAPLRTSVDTLFTCVFQRCFDFYCGSEEIRLFESKDDLLSLLDDYYLDCIVGSLKIFVEDFYSRHSHWEERIQEEVANSHTQERRSSRKQSGTRKSRPNLPREAKEILMKWFGDHVMDPYPKLVDKELLSEKTGLPLKNIENWFINERSRKWHTYSNSGGY